MVQKEKVETTYLIPTAKIADFLGNLDSGEKAIVEYRGFPNDDYLVTTDSFVDHEMHPPYCPKMSQ